MSNLVINEKPMLLLPNFAKKIGLNEAIFVQQLHYWLQRSNHEHDGYKWVYNTYEDWQAQFPFWSISTVKRIISKLESEKIIISSNYNRMKMDKTKWYRINYELLNLQYGGEEEEGRSPSKTHKTYPSLGENKKEDRLAEQEEIRHSIVSNSKKEETLLGQNNPSVSGKLVQGAPIYYHSNTRNRSLNSSNWKTNGIKWNKAIPETSSEITQEDFQKKIITTITTNAAANKRIPIENAFRFFKENGFGTLNHYYVRKISDWSTKLSEELVIEALKRAIEMGKMNWKYVDAILSYWLKSDFQTIKQIEDAERKFREQRNRRRQQMERRYWN
ncbi:DnaD domain protein [Caldibacillus lycopersici]|uniref:DnaD domain protein n=1 Tax=Perspicuibacillus lycopersici TaxID=1325689 RepID=A0AAE3LRQ2_9BACI|nr:DnaD domain protein [Perspicuibacillus lycopersici]MCU9614919.1 DnaD domain protein [Perspicuibacillus lycopersici]